MRFNWRAIVVVCLIGFALTALSVVGADTLHWRNSWPAVLLEYGGNTVLGALIFVLQGSFVRSVQEGAAQVVQRVDDRANQLEARVDEEARRIDDLTARVEGARAARHAEEDAVIDAAVDELTYDALYQALHDLDFGGLISRNVFRIRASRDLDGLRLALKITFLMDRADGRTGSPRISISPWFPVFRDVQPLEWLPGEDAVTVLERVTERLEQARLDASVAAFDPNFFADSLRESFLLARGSTRGEVAALRGPLIERTDDRWVFTDAGLESRTDDIFVPFDAFPATLKRFQDPGSEPYSPPLVPAGVDPLTWSTLMEAARHTYTGHGGMIQRRGFGGVRSSVPPRSGS